MKLIDRYIVRLYLTNVLVLLVLLAGFVVTVDVFVNLGRFSSTATEQLAAAPDAEAQGVQTIVRTVVLVADFWGPKLLQLYNYLVGVVLLVGMGFTCAQLVRQREFVALLASGVPLQRVALPFIAVAVIFTGGQALNQELVIPRLAPLLARDAGDAGQRELDAFRVELVPDGEGRLFYADRFDPQTGMLDDVMIFRRGDDGALEQVVQATTAAWDGSAWALEDGRAAPPGVPLTEGAGVVVERIASPLDPTRLQVRHLQGFGESLAWGQITRILRDGGLDERAAERLDRVRWGRVASMVSNLVTLVAALAFFLKRLPTTMVTASLQAAPVGLLGLLAAGAAPSMPIGGLPVWAGVFLPTLILLPLAIALFSGVKT